MILIISFKDNEHVEKVRRHLTRESAVVDVSWFPASMRLDAQLANESENIRFGLPDGSYINLGQVGAVWNRRIRPLELHQELTDQTARLFAWSECNEALLGSWYSLRCFWMNPPTADEISQRKIRQLQVARSLGLSIPETIVTNDPVVARDFILLHGPGQVIRKAFRNIPQAPRETSLVANEDLAIIDSVRYAPVIFQRFVPANLDLRVTIIESEIFAAAIRSQPEHKVDYRLHLGSAEVTPYQLPDDVASKLLGLMKAFDLKFGAIDLRVTPQGEHVFLEVNPAGEYLFISERTGQPIPAAIAASLERHDAEHEKQRPMTQSRAQRARRTRAQRGRVLMSSAA